MTVVRQRTLNADPSNWLPILIINGTSVTTGRRIIASDVDTLTQTYPEDTEATDIRDKEISARNRKCLKLRDSAKVGLTAGAKPNNAKINRIFQDA